MENKPRVKKIISKSTKSRVKNFQKIFIILGLCLGLFILTLFFNSKYFSKTNINLPSSINENKIETKTEITPVVTQQITPIIIKSNTPSDWRIYTNKSVGFSVKYPQTFFSKEGFWADDNDKFAGVTFGPRELIHDSFWGIFFYSKDQSSIEEIKKQIGSQFSDRVQTEENISINGINAIRVTTKSENSDWVEISIIFSDKNGNLYVTGGDLDERTNDTLLRLTNQKYNIKFEDFYSSFKFTK